jgi:hypothetical protein
MVARPFKDFSGRENRKSLPPIFVKGTVGLKASKAGIAFLFAIDLIIKASLKRFVVFSLMTRALLLSKEVFVFFQKNFFRQGF